MTKDSEAGGKTGRKDKKEARVLTPTNLSKLRVEMANFLEELDAKKDDQEKMNGEFRTDIAQIKERAANKTGHSKATLNMVYDFHRKALKHEKWRKEAEKADIDAFDEVMAASEGIKDTPLFRAAREKMAPAPDATKH